jgi:ADP-ribosylation factor-like protein 2
VHASKLGRSIFKHSAILVVSAMGLLSILRKIKEREREMRVLFLGLDNAGKTTVVRKLQGEDTEQIAPTLGFSIVSLELGPHTLHVWDVGGQRSLRSYWRNYFEENDAVVWVVDSADTRRLDDCAAELHSLLKEEKLQGATLLILANKQDLPGALSAKEIAERLGLDDGAVGRDRHWKVLASSATTGENLLEGMEWLVEDVASRIFVLE